MSENISIYIVHSDIQNTEVVHITKGKNGQNQKHAKVGEISDTYVLILKPWLPFLSVAGLL